MRFVFVFVVVLACIMLGAGMVFADSGVMGDSIICLLGALISFLLAYQMQKQSTFLYDD